MVLGDEYMVRWADSEGEVMAESVDAADREDGGRSMMWRRVKLVKAWAEE